MKRKKLSAESDATPTTTEPAEIPLPDPSPDLPILSPEEHLFITYLFAENMNRTRAYMRMYPRSSPEAAKSSASRLLTKANLQEEIVRRLNEEAMSVAEGIARVSRVARGTIQPFLKQGSDGFMYFDLSHPDAQENMFLVREMETKRERRIVGAGEAAEEWEGEWVKVKLHDAYAATVDLLKIHGKFTKKVEVTGKDGTPLNPPINGDEFTHSLSMFTDAIKSLIEGEEKPPKPNE